MKKRALLLMTVLSMNSYAQTDGTASSPYSFGGACASQGTWTQSALTATQNLRKITNHLKNDPACKSMGVSVRASLDGLKNSINQATNTPERTLRMSQIPSEIGALRGFVSSTPVMKENVLKLMMNRAIQGASLSAQVGPAAGMSSSLMDFGSRLRTSTITGIKLLDDVMDDIPKLNDCLVGDSAASMGAFISMSAQVAASFAGSGQDGLSTHLARTVSKLANLQRDVKFSKVLRKLNQQEFLTSMTCLLEVTSESYCQARDSMGLFKDGMNNLYPDKGRLGAVVKDNPFAGYYILNTHVPIVTKWLQKIQVGVDPKLPNDADFQNKILNEMNDYQKSVKELLGTYNFTRGSLQSFSTVEARQNAVLKLILSLTAKMSDTFSTSGSSSTNFFTISKTQREIPFYLIGMPIPDQVSGRMSPQLSYQEWLEINKKTVPAFQDPSALADSIGMKMKSLIQEANISSIEYFNKWFIVDKPSLVNESVIDVQYTVKDSLKAIEEYLALLQERMASLGGDETITPTIIDTRYRIQKILVKYTELENLGKRMRNVNPRSNLSPETLSEPAQAYEEIINTVYEQFNVQLARSGFLANRMTNFVNQDYVLLLKSKKSFTRAQQDLFYSVGMSGLEKMLQLYNGNPANLQSDLNMALKINKGNIQALEMMLKDNLINMIAESKLVSEGKSSVVWDSTKRLVKNSINKPGVAGIINKSGFGLAENILYELWNHSDRYSFSNLDSSQGPESEFQDSKAVYTQLCIQALAFYDQSGIKGLCDGAVMISPLKKYGGAYISYNKRLNSYLSDTSSDWKGRSMSSSMKASMNHSERICAMRDYNRQNMVLYMTIGKK